VPLASANSGFLTFPWTVGQLHVTAAQLEGRRRTDSIELTAAAGREVGLALLDLRASALEAKPRLELAELRATLLGLATRGLREGTPLHAIQLDLVRRLMDSPLSQLGVTLLRYSPASARVEITTAGMPPVACVQPGGHVTLHGVASPPLTALSHAPSPVELTPLTWGSTWLIISDGFDPTGDQPALVTRLAAELELASLGVALSREQPRALAELLAKLPATSQRSERDDATLALVSADPSARLKSGIEGL